MSWFDLLMLLRKHESGVSPLMEAPCISNSIFMCDWLHAVDLGIAQDFVGNVFKYAVKQKKVDGSNEDLRAGEIFIQLQAWYKRTGCTEKLNNLKKTMLWKDNKPPKLKAKGAETRGLIPFCEEFCVNNFSTSDEFENTIIQAAKRLHACYVCAKADEFDVSTLKRESTMFCILYAALEKTSADSISFRVKPKMHLFQEFTQNSFGRPTSTYRDEDFGGTLASIGRSKGGHVTPSAMGQRVFVKFMSKNPVPAIF